ncbi:DNA internalization-related competence protein ComEC/Rec2 [Gemmatimonadota bacterium]
MVGLALAVCAGASAVHLGLPLLLACIPLSLLLLPRQTSNRPALTPGKEPCRDRAPPDRTAYAWLSPPRSLLLGFVAGAILTGAGQAAETRDCRWRFREDEVLGVQGRFSSRVVEGRGEFRPEAGVPGGCQEPIRVVFPFDPGREASPGAPLLLHGRWRSTSPDLAISPLRAGYLRIDSLEHAGIRKSAGGLISLLRGQVQARLSELFPRRHALVEALVLARKEGLGAEVRESFARAGVAHLLAISGFHVGVVAGLLILLARTLGLPPRLRLAVASCGVWSYVGFIGLPDAAARAALILTVLALGRFVDRPVVPLGSLATAFLLFFLTDPGALLRPGFQLSFAGAFGLALGLQPISRWLMHRSRNRLPPFICGAVAAGVSATLATFPLVAWHFGRVSLVGIPVTLLGAPLVALVIPGIFGALLLSPITPLLAQILASGVELMLELFSVLVHWASGLPLAWVWVSRPGVLAGLTGFALTAAALRLLPRRQGLPRFLLVTGALSGVLLWPLGEMVLNRGGLELVVMDVGQGDALALRSPRGRWVLVDAGPRSRTFDAGKRRVVPFLRRRGARSIELLILTHPDMDHVGGAPAVLQELVVEGVADPGLPAGKEVFLDVLETAAQKEVPWRILRAGDSLVVDGVVLRVLGPERIFPGTAGDSTFSGTEEGVNAASLVLELRFGAFGALLTGDAPVSSEERFLDRVLSSRVQVLKVGHHGSATSTSRELLERVCPEAALISVGARNWYGHPHPDVLRRLEAAGAQVHRTDRSGTLVLKARRDGSFRVRPARNP